MRRRFAFVLISMALVLVFFRAYWAPIAAVLCALLALGFLEGRESLRSVRPAVLLGVALVPAGLFGILVWSVGWERGSVAAGMLASRILVLASFAHLLARSLDAEGILMWTKEHGLEKLGLALSLSLNALPALSAALQEVWIGHRNRFSSRRSAVLRAPGLLELLLAHTARIATDAAAAAALRGHSGVVEGAGLSAPPEMPILVLSGPAGAGKTPVLEELCRILKVRSIPLSGFLQPKFSDEQGRRGFRIRDLSSGEEALLAMQAPREEGSFGTSFHFEAEGMRLGAEALRAARDQDLLFIDELGPVELRGGGHSPALQAKLGQIRPKALILVLRRHLVPAFIARLDAVDVRVIDLGQGYEEGLARMLEEIEEILGLGD